MKKLACVIVALFGFNLLLLQLAQPARAESAFARSLLDWSRFNSTLVLERMSVPPQVTEKERWGLDARQSYAILSPPPGRGGLRAALTLSVRQAIEESSKTEITPGISLTIYPGKP